MRFCVVCDALRLVNQKTGVCRRCTPPSSDQCLLRDALAQSRRGYYGAGGDYLAKGKR